MIIGLDVGGTHTDAVLLDGDGLRKEAKVPTRAGDLFTSVLAGLEAVTKGVDPSGIRRIVLSTTLTTNAVVQRKTPPVGMIVSAGPGIDPELLRTNPDYVAVKGSIDHRGREVAPIDPAEIAAAAESFRGRGIRQLGVVGKFSVRNPAHELQVEQALKGSFEKIFLGHRVSGNLSFPRRIATTYLNAAVYPLHRQFFEAVQSSLKARGLTLPLRLLKADGGNMRFEASMEFPAQTIFSGPAASVMGAVAASAGEEGDSLVMDIGGTTTDLAVLIGRAPALDPLGISIEGYRTLIRSLETLSIGLGGDSAVRVEAGGLTVGPQREGPAILYGGTVPTPTDALAALGEIPGVDGGPSRRGLQPLADELGTGVEEFAARVIETVCGRVLAAAEALVARINSKPVYTVHELMEGYRVRPRSILVLGGPAPFFAGHLARMGPCAVKVVPRWQVANAIGAGLARTTCETTLFADTEQGVARAPAENFVQPIEAEYGLQDAERQALELLKAKALERGANPDTLEMEVVERQQFNMVRGFHTSGRNIRVRVQVKPGLIHGYDGLLAMLSARTAA